MCISFLSCMNVGADAGQWEGMWVSGVRSFGTGAQRGSSLWEDHRYILWGRREYTHSCHGWGERGEHTASPTSGPPEPTHQHITYRYALTLLPQEHFHTPASEKVHSHTPASGKLSHTCLRHALTHLPQAHHNDIYIQFGIEHYIHITLTLI